MSAVRKFYKEHNIAVFLFGFVVLYNICITSEFQLPEISSLVTSFHAVDFSMGFCTKLLVGAIYNLFFDTVKSEYILLLEGVFLLFLFVVAAFLLEKVIVSTDIENRNNIFLLAILFLTGPCTFSMYVKEVGSFDVYWVLGCALFFLLLTNKKLYFLIFPLFLGVLMVHYGVILCYIPFMVIVMLYKISCSENKIDRSLLLIVSVISSVAVIGLFFYMLANELDNVTYTVDEFRAIITQRGATETDYYDYSLYRTGNDTVTYAEMFPDLIKYSIDTGSVIKNLYNTVVLQFLFTMRVSSPSDDFLPLLLIAPLLILIYKCIFFLFKSEKSNIIKRFSLFCMAVLFFFTYVISTFTSMDDLRWITHSFFPLFATFIYICYVDRDRIMPYCSELINKIPRGLIYVYIMLYGVVTIVPYN